MLLCYGPLQVGITLIHGGEAGSEVTAAQAQDFLASGSTDMMEVEAAPGAGCGAVEGGGAYAQEDVSTFDDME